MCTTCKERLHEIRDGLVHGVVPGASYFSWQEYGCWACDGQGTPTKKPFLEADEAMWNVYAVSRFAFPGGIQHEAVTETTYDSVRFMNPDQTTWQIRLANWFYSEYDIDECHEFVGIQRNPHTARSEEEMHCVFHGAPEKETAVDLNVRIWVVSKRPDGR